MSNRRGVTVEREGQEYLLKAYASGSGALSFTATYDVDEHKSAQSIYVLEDDVKAYRDKFMPDRLIIDELYKSERANHWALVANVERVDENHLTLGGRTYEIGEETGNQIGPHKFYINHELLGRNEVENLSTKSALNYYIKNEENIEMSRDKFGNEKVMDKRDELKKEADGPSM